MVGEYAAATVTGAPHPVLAQAFVDHLASAAGASVFEEFGFSLPA